MRTLIAFVSTVFLFSGSLLAGNVTMKGSDTMVRLGQRWAEEYMRKNPGTVIQVSGGGSGTGIAALLNKSTDICQASRDMKTKEYDQAKAKGIKLVRISMALDGVAVYVHKENPVSKLTLAQLKAIYTGAVTNWKEIGGPDQRIIVYSRENNSGTYGFFKEHVLENADFADFAQTLSGTAAVVNAVSKDKFGIGYGGIAWAKDIKFLAVQKNDSSEAVLPSVETVTAGTYPISRELYWFFNGQPTGAQKDLTNWALSEEGQKLAETIDYVPLPKEMAAKNRIP